MGRMVYRLLDEGRGLLQAVEGYLPGSTFARAHRTFMAEHADLVAASTWWFSDYEHLDASGISSDDVADLVTTTTRRFEAHQLIGVLAPGDVAYGMTRMWELRSEDGMGPVAIERDRARLLDWFATRLGGPIDLSGGEVLLEVRHEGE